MWEDAGGGASIDLAEYRAQWLGLRAPTYRPKGPGRANPAGIIAARRSWPATSTWAGGSRPRGDDDWGPIRDAATLDAIICAYVAHRAIRTPERRWAWAPRPGAGCWCPPTRTCATDSEATSPPGRRRSGRTVGASRVPARRTAEPGCSEPTVGLATSVGERTTREPYDMPASNGANPSRVRSHTGIGHGSWRHSKTERTTYFLPPTAHVGRC